MSNVSGFIKRLRDIMRNDAGINGDAQRIEQIIWALFLKVYDVKEQDWLFDDDSYQSIIPEGYHWSDWAHDDHSGSAMTGDTLLDFVNNKLFPTLKKLDVDANTPIKKTIVKTMFEDANQYMKDGALLRQVINVIDELKLDDYEESHAFGEIYETILKELQSAGSAGEFYTPRAITDLMAMIIDPQIGERMADLACGTGGFITSWLKFLDKKIKTTDDRTAYGNSIYGIEKKQFPYMLCITNMLLHDIDIPRIDHGNSLLRDLLDYTDADKFDVILMNPPYGGNEKNDVKQHFPADLASSETADLFMAVIMYRLKKGGRAAVVLPDSFLTGVDAAKVSIKKLLFSKFNVHTIVRLPGSCFAPYTPIATNIVFFENTNSTGKTWFYRFDLPNEQKFSMKKNPITLQKLEEINKWINNKKEIQDPVQANSKVSWKSRQVSIDEIRENNFDLGFCGYPISEDVILSPAETASSYLSEKTDLDKKIRSEINAILDILGVKE